MNVPMQPATVHSCVYENNSSLCTLLYDSGFSGVNIMNNAEPRTHADCVRSANQQEITSPTTMDCVHAVVEGKQLLNREPSHRHTLGGFFLFSAFLID